MYSVEKAWPKKFQPPSPVVFEVVLKGWEKGPPWMNIDGKGIPD